MKLKYRSFDTGKSMGEIVGGLIDESPTPQRPVVEKKEVKIAEYSEKPKPKVQALSLEQVKKVVVKKAPVVEGGLNRPFAAYEDTERKAYNPYV